MRTVASPKPDCPAAPPSRRTIAVRAAHRACVLLGGTGQLAAHLKVSEGAVRGWLEGENAVPEEVFIASVEIILLAAEEGRGSAS